MNKVMYEGKMYDDEAFVGLVHCYFRPVKAALGVIKETLHHSEGVGACEPDIVQLIESINMCQILQETALEKVDNAIDLLEKKYGRLYFLFECQGTYHRYTGPAEPHFYVHGSPSAIVTEDMMEEVNEASNEEVPA